MIRTVSAETDLSEEQVKEYFEKANNDSKAVLLMIKGNLSYEDSKKLLDEHKGRVRKALNSIGLD